MDNTQFAKIFAICFMIVAIIIFVWVTGDNYTPDPVYSTWGKPILGECVTSDGYCNGLGTQITTEICQSINGIPCLLPNGAHTFARKVTTNSCIPSCTNYEWEIRNNPDLAFVDESGKTITGYPDNTPTTTFPLGVYPPPTLPKIPLRYPHVTDFAWTPPLVSPNYNLGYTFLETGAFVNTNNINMLTETKLSDLVVTLFNNGTSYRFTNSSTDTISFPLSDTDYTFTSTDSKTIIINLHDLGVFGVFYVNMDGTSGNVLTPSYSFFPVLSPAVSDASITTSFSLTGDTYLSISANVLTEDLQPFRYSDLYSGLSLPSQVAYTYNYYYKLMQTFVPSITLDSYLSSLSITYPIRVSIANSFKQMLYRMSVDSVFANVVTTNALTSGSYSVARIEITNVNAAYTIVTNSVPTTDPMNVANISLLLNTCIYNVVRSYTPTTTLNSNFVSPYYETMTSYSQLRVIVEGLIDLATANGIILYNGELTNCNLDKDGAANYISNPPPGPNITLPTRNFDDTFTTESYKYYPAGIETDYPSYPFGYDNVCLDGDRTGVFYKKFECVRHDSNGSDSGCSVATKDLLFVPPECTIFGGNATCPVGTTIYKGSSVPFGSSDSIYPKCGTWQYTDGSETCPSLSSLYSTQVYLPGNYPPYLNPVQYDLSLTFPNIVSSDDSNNTTRTWENTPFYDVAAREMPETAYPGVFQLILQNSLSPSDSTLTPVTSNISYIKGVAMTKMKCVVDNVEVTGDALPCPLSQFPSLVDMSRPIGDAYGYDITGAVPKITLTPDSPSFNFDISSYDSKVYVDSNNVPYCLQTAIYKPSISLANAAIKNLLNTPFHIRLADDSWIALNNIPDSVGSNYLNSGVSFSGSVSAFSDTMADPYYPLEDTPIISFSPGAEYPYQDVGTNIASTASIIFARAISALNPVISGAMNSIGQTDQSLYSFMLDGELVTSADVDYIQVNLLCLQGGNYLGYLYHTYYADDNFNITWAQSVNGIVPKNHGDTVTLDIGQVEYSNTTFYLVAKKSHSSSQKWNLLIPNTNFIPLNVTVVTYDANEDALPTGFASINSPDSFVSSVEALPPFQNPGEYLDILGTKQDSNRLSNGTNNDWAYVNFQRDGVQLIAIENSVSGTTQNSATSYISTDAYVPPIIFKFNDGSGVATYSYFSGSGTVPYAPSNTKKITINEGYGPNILIAAGTIAQFGNSSAFYPIATGKTNSSPTEIGYGNITGRIVNMPKFLTIPTRNGDGSPVTPDYSNVAVDISTESGFETYIKFRGIRCFPSYTNNNYYQYAPTGTYNCPDC